MRLGLVSFPGQTIHVVVENPGCGLKSLKAYIIQNTLKIGGAKIDCVVRWTKTCPILSLYPSVAALIVDGLNQ